MEQQVILSLGSNLGDRKKNLHNAIKKMEEKFGTKFFSSSLYETMPWGFSSENLFLNSCVYFYTDLFPLEILKITQQIENDLGRKNKTQHRQYHSRLIDIDILYIGDLVIDSITLTIPHPLLYERNFVLIPLAELLPDFIDFTRGKTIRELFSMCEDKSKAIFYQLNS